jgi:preprotein translocase subunit SecA
MNKQRELIYTQRNKVLDGEDIKDTVFKMIEDTIDSYCGIYLSDPIADNWDFKGLREYFMGWLTTPFDFNYTPEELSNKKQERPTDYLGVIRRPLYFSS